MYKVVQCGVTLMDFWGRRSCGSHRAELLGIDNDEDDVIDRWPAGTGVEEEATGAVLYTTAEVGVELGGRLAGI
jgi:hypothetical protein